MIMLKAPIIGLVAMFSAIDSIFGLEEESDLIKRNTS